MGAAPGIECCRSICPNPYRQSYPSPPQTKQGLEVQTSGSQTSSFLDKLAQRQAFFSAKSLGEPLLSPLGPERRLVLGISLTRRSDWWTKATLIAFLDFMSLDWDVPSRPLLGIASRPVSLSPSHGRKRLIFSCLQSTKSVSAGCHRYVSTR